MWLGSSVTYGYDGWNELTKVSLSGGVIRRYSYDADGRRVRSYDGASRNTRFVYSGLNVVYEVPDGGGSGTLRFYVGGQQVAEKTGSTVTYLHQDHLGSTRLITDASGNRVFRSNYQPFGVDSGKSGSEEFRYTGKPTDDSTGLYYYGARYYDPSIARFVTVDPALPDLSDPQSLNRYVYCRNNPQKYTDPNGFWALQIGVGGSAGIGTFGVGGGLGGGIVISYYRTTGWQLGYYSSISAGPSFNAGGIGASGGLEGTYSPSATRIDQIGGDSMDIKVEVKKGFGIGVGISYPIKENKVDFSDPSYSLSPPFTGIGSQTTLQVFYTHTDVHFIWKQQIDDRPWMVDHLYGQIEPIPIMYLPQGLL